MRRSRGKVKESKVPGCGRRFLLVLVDAECVGGALHAATERSLSVECGKPTGEVERWVATLPCSKNCKGGWNRSAEMLWEGEGVQGGSAAGATEVAGGSSWTAEEVLSLLRSVHGHRLLDIVWLVGGGLCPESAGGLEMYKVLSAAKDFLGASLRIVFEGGGGQARDWALILDGEAVQIRACVFEEGLEKESVERLFCERVAWRVEMHMPCMTDSGPSLSFHNLRLVM